MQIRKPDPEVFRCVPGPGCGPPPQVIHAEVQFSSTAPGAVAQYMCRPGFTPLPRATRTLCGVSGTWSLPPACQGKGWSRWVPMMHHSPTDPTLPAPNRSHDASRLQTLTLTAPNLSHGASRLQTPALTASIFSHDTSLSSGRDFLTLLNHSHHVPPSPDRDINLTELYP